MFLREQSCACRDQAAHESDKAVLERDLLKAELAQTRMVQETTANRDQLKSELERLQRRQRQRRKARKPIEPLMARSRPDLKMEVDEVPRASFRCNLDRVAQEQMSEDLETWTPPEPTLPLRDLESGRIRPLMVDVALPALTSSSTGGNQVSARTSRL